MQPGDIYSDCARGSLFDDFDAQIQMLAGLFEESSPHKDGLEYVHSALRNSCELARLVSEKSPIRARANSYS